ncbi:MAG TPA: tetratricopeptide repeat protein [Bryobacteraceae bacterium]|nr:tetratricopeptide repeat protein [Bryobacteraceae bacterium]
MLIGLACLASAQAPSGAASGQAEWNRAYAALGKQDYDPAITLFRAGLVKEPGNAHVHKDLAYALLKTGENVEARDEFEIALQLSQKEGSQRDETAALEFAFLAFETQKPIEARRTFDQLRKTGSTATRATAEQAFQNIDRPLRDGIARWQQALARSEKPNDLSMFSAHWELAQLAELRDELPLAAEQFEICRSLKPAMGELLLILARVWQQLNRVDEAKAAWLAASRSSESRTAELALEKLGQRYPYPYEFVNALKLDPRNTALLKELGYLYLAMHQEPLAIEQFERVLEVNPKDTAAREQLDALHRLKARATEAPGVAASGAAPAPAMDAKSMGEKSLALGYSRDAIQYLLQAHKQDPEDAEVMLKLGWAYNLAKDDEEAIAWFGFARRANEEGIRAQATKAYHALNGDPVAQTTVWALPMYSSRWHDLFSYSQVKRSIPLPWMGSANRLFSFYLSTRFLGDIKSGQQMNAINPQYLSESSFIFGAGISTRAWHRITGWVEAGEAVNYLPGRKDIALATPDYRGGLNFAKGFGSLLGSPKPGFFYETTADAIYVSRFDKDWLIYSQHRAGRTFRLGEGNSFQMLWNGNVVRDLKNQYWANTVEFGPGVKLHMSWMPRGLYFATDFMRGVYLNNLYNPRGPNYNDIRVSFWYAATKQ